MNAIDLIRQAAAVVKQAEEAQSAFSYIATSLENDSGITKKEHLASHARYHERRLFDVLHPDQGK